MSECACEGELLGRHPVQGTANADSLAALIRIQLARNSTNSANSLSRKYRLRCSRDGIELRPARKQEDEGFESDDDTVSQTSSDSNSTCCLVEDHVLKGGTDSANSSGASDNDDGDNSLTVTTQTTEATTLAATPRPKIQSTEECISKEFYAFHDVAFCHTDFAFPKVVVFVIRKKYNRHKVDPSTGLEAVIFQCKSVENLREVCSSYKEFSRRLKMDFQFRYPHRRKESVLDSSTNTLYKNVLNDMQKPSTNSGSPVTPFFKTWITNVSGKSQVICREMEAQSPESSRYNLVQRTDDDGVTHIEVSKANGEYANSLVDADEYSGSSSIISISTPDVGNLVMPTIGLQIQPPSLISPADTDTSEIEGVICANLDSSPLVFKKNPEGTLPVEDKDKFDKSFSVNQDSTSPNVNIPPQRPERGKYIKKSITKQKESHQNNEKSKTTNEVERPVPKSPAPDMTKQPGTQEKVVRGQFIRVTVEQPVTPSPSLSLRQAQSDRPRLFSGDKPAGQMLSYPVWSLPSAPAHRARSRRAREDETDYRSRNEPLGQAQRPRQPRSRSTGGTGTGRRSTSPVTLRYIEPNPSPAPAHKRFFGKLREIASINNAYVGTLSRRRNSSGGLATAQFYHYLEPSVSKSSSNLKSVIKKKNCNEHIEPKKVTFSAYATVQVVD